MCFDGGGLRGVMGTIILERLLVEFPDLMSKVDFFAGCSNGAMIAMSLAFGHTPSSCRTLLEVTGEIIFTKGGLASGYNSAKFASHYLKLVCDESWVCRLLPLDFRSHVDSEQGTRRLKDAEKFVLVRAALFSRN